MSTSQFQPSTTARNNILAKLKQQVQGADYNKLPQESEYQYPKLSHAEQIAQFINHLEANHAQVIKVSQEEIAQTLAEQLKARNIESLLYGEQGPLARYLQDMPADISLNNFDFIVTGHQKNKEMLFNHTPAGITSSRCAIAATGTIVVWPTPEEPRTLSLVPPVHFVVVDADHMYPSFKDLVRAQQWQDKLPTNALLISGPSKTADIQQTLAYGAHGPKELIVLLLNA